MSVISVFHIVSSLVSVCEMQADGDDKSKNEFPVGEYSEDGEG